MNETQSAPQKQHGKFGEVNVFQPGANGLPCPPQNLPVEEERELRKRELAATFRLFGRFGFSEGVAGHVTARDPELPDHFWLNPFGMSFSQIKVSDLILVNEQGEVVEGKGTANWAAFCIHSEVHKARPDVVAAAHTHSLYGKALASLGKGLEPITQDATAFYQDHGLYAEYGGPAGYKEEGERIATAVGGSKAAVLQNHGLITVGHSVGEAAWWFITMERSCQAQLLAMAAGKPIHIDHETAEFSRKEVGSHYAGWLSFRPLWDQITAEQPDLFD
ncbi:class II aldolase/adducin family protein [Streptomyces sp. AV19]|uniref:class II aldolase/adducin family protein n=1 Tax=Streptomyces sp. AV19 TaxID=2793068 RepID=UPI0018FED51A|nr:class II aldolase/adducin family protein [Streptomyces sp. AV19]MBH1937942.1 class II aldolase/adducin family protein [Streptomyces sp. AV19]MDG4536881.1 class II aldolase/adducin family protein [Streptomyces sp. AV19]